MIFRANIPAAIDGALSLKVAEDSEHLADGSLAQAEGPYTLAEGSVLGALEPVGPLPPGTS